MKKPVVCGSNAGWIGGIAFRDAESGVHPAE
jgi:hypothetical protein